MKKLIFAAFICALGVSAQTQTIQPAYASDFQQSSPKKGMVLWSVSALTLVAAHALDWSSSMALNGTDNHETNAFVRSSDGYYSAGKGAALNVGLTAGPLAVEWIILRHHPRWRRGFAVVNFSMSAVPLWAGAHNLSLRQ